MTSDEHHRGGISHRWIHMLLCWVPQPPPEPFTPPSPPTPPPAPHSHIVPETFCGGGGGLAGGGGGGEGWSRKFIVISQALFQCVAGRQ